MRYADLLRAELQTVTAREIARATGLGIASISDYAHMPKEPRLAQLKKLSAYFGESIGQLISEDDDLTAELITHVRTLDEQRKRDLLKQLRETTP